MVKKNKKEDNYDEPQGKVAAIIILIIMVLSIAGFAVLMGGPAVDNGSNSNLASEVPMGEIFQNPNTGEVYLGTIRNNEQFIFQDITGYEEDLQMLDIAENIKSKEVIEVYVDSTFNSDESVFLIEKALTGIKKIYTRTLDSTCTTNKLVLTTNETFDSNCIVFSTALNDEYRRADILVYHLVK